jgi:AhpD family alkylhydroperoxidase
MNRTHNSKCTHLTGGRQGPYDILGVFLAMGVSRMKQRLSYISASPEAFKAMRGLEAAVQGSSIEKPLVELVKMRASQINGCAFCIDMHWKDARAEGETEQRLYGLSAWREAPYYSDRERAALEWTEALTLVADTNVPDAVFDAVRPHFTDKELMDLTLAIVAINAWNRIAIGFRSVPGSYQRPTHAQAPKAVTI